MLMLHVDIYFSKFLHSHAGIHITKTHRKSIPNNKYNILITSYHTELSLIDMGFTKNVALIKHNTN